MLPFLKKDKAAGISVEYRIPDNGKEPDMLESAAKDILEAINAKDYKRLSTAIRSAFTILESEPHEEASDNSTDSV